MYFISLITSTTLALALSVAARPAPVVRPPLQYFIIDIFTDKCSLQNTANGIVSLEEMKAWVDRQNPSNITIIGDPFNTLGRRDGAVTVTFCTQKSGTICSGSCTVQSGNGQCIATPGTNCLFATSDVAFCDSSDCGGSCNEFDSCGTVLENGFCDTPGTKGIAIPFIA